MREAGAKRALISSECCGERLLFADARASWAAAEERRGVRRPPELRAQNKQRGPAPTLAAIKRTVRSVFMLAGILGLGLMLLGR